MIHDWKSSDRKQWFWQLQRKRPEPCSYNDERKKGQNTILKISCMHVGVCSQLEFLCLATESNNLPFIGPPMSITALIMATSTAEVTLPFITRFNSKVSMGMFPVHKIAGHVTFMTIHLGIQEVLTNQLVNLPFPIPVTFYNTV